MWVLEDCSPKDTCCPSHPPPHHALVDRLETTPWRSRDWRSVVQAVLFLCGGERDCVCLCLRAHACSRECESVCVFVCVCARVSRPGCVSSRVTTRGRKETNSFWGAI